MKLLKNLLAVSFGILIALIIGEIILNIYNPIPFRVKGNKIILPANQKYIIKNNFNSKLDTLIIHTKNNLGFRGKEKPVNFDDILSIIAVGGSTTECFYLTDGKDWVSLVGNNLKKSNENIWINNAGFDGHSTFGHNILLKDYLIDIKPDFILYLAGCNDVGRNDLNEYDKDNLQGKYGSVKNWLYKNSEIIGLIVNISRGLDAKRNNLIHQEVLLEKLEHTQVYSKHIDNQILKHQSYLASYEERLYQLAKTSKNNSINPIFITQPTLVGKGIDQETGIDLETIQLMSKEGGKVYWTILELYNEVMRKVAQKENILLIDLAHELPKNSRYFYDGLHFTNEGAEKVSEIVSENLEKYLKTLSLSKPKLYLNTD